MNPLEPADRLPQARPASAIGRLFAEPWRFQFFQALRLVEAWQHRRNGTPRAQVLRRHVRFRNSLSLAFPPSEIESLQRDGDGLELVPACFGLLGAGGALPLAYTELFARREAQHKDTAARAFLDLFLQRAVTLFYEAWRKHRLPLRDENEDDRQVLKALLSLAGFGEEGLRNRHRHVRDESIAHFAGPLQQTVRSSVQIQQVLAGYFDVPMRLETFVGRWRTTIPSATRLGKNGGVLGRTAVVGARVWQRHLRLRLVVGPLTRAQFDDFLPGGRGCGALAELLPLLAGVTPEVEMRLLLRADAVPPLRLDACEPARLGWNSWLRAQPPPHALDDARYDLIPEPEPSPAP